MSEVAKRRLVHAAPWILLESLLNAVAGVGMMMVIGRLIGPTEYGKATAVISTVLLIELVSSFGVVEAIVQSKNKSGTALDTAFWTGLGMGLAGTAATAVCAPLLAWSYGDPHLATMAGIYGISCTLTGLSAVPLGVLIRKMRARALMLRTLLSKAVVLAVGVALAKLDYGAWSVLISMLAGSAAACATLWARHLRPPGLSFDGGEFQRMAHFGGLLSADLFVAAVAARLSLLLIGATQGYTILGYFAFALRIVDELSSLVGTFASRFGLAYFSSLQSARELAAKTFERGTHYATSFTLPALFGVAVVAPDAVPVIFGHDWQPAVIIVQIFAVAWGIMLTRILAAPLLRSIGAQTELVVATAATSALTIAAVACASAAGNAALAIILSLKPLLMWLVTLLLVRRYYGIDLPAQVRPLVSPALSVAIMVVGVEIVRRTAAAAPAPARLVAGILVGAVVYQAAMIILDSEYRRFASRALQWFAARGGATLMRAGRRS